MLEAIHAQGLEIHVLAPDLQDYPDELNQLQQLGYQVHTVPMQRTGTNPIQDLKTLKAMYQLIRQIQPDYVLLIPLSP